MTCENPIYIQNQTKSFRKGLTKVGFHVPCGKCPACLQAQHDEWFLRAYAQWKETIDNGGKTYFVTLTFAPKSLPVFNTETGRLRHGEDKEGIPCFCKDDVDRYRNTLSKWFERRGVTGLRYLICSEYGLDEKATHRPHYHGLIHVPHNTLPQKEVEDAILDCWKFGIAFYSNKGAEVETTDAIRYVTKYCCKQIDFYEREDLKEFLKDKRNKARIKPYLPRHYQSKGYGAHLYKWLLQKDDLTPYFEHGVGSDYLGLGVSRFYNLPRYIINKILYYTDENGFRKFTEKGAYILGKLYSVKLRQSEVSLSKCFTVNGLRSLIDMEDVHKVIRDKNILGYKNNYSGLINYLYDNMYGHTLKELALYKRVYRDRTCEDYMVDVIENASIEELQTLGFALSDNSTDEDNYDYYEDAVKDYGFFEGVKTFNSLKRFKGFDTVLEAIQLVQSLHSKRVTTKKDADKKIINKLKNVL